jgi:hypothetical protein
MGISFLISLVAGFVGGSRPLAAAVVLATIALAAAGAAWGGFALVKHWGAEELRAQIEKENQDAIRKGIEASRNFDDCNAASGVWDFRRQRCSGAAPGDR